MVDRFRPYYFDPIKLTGHDATMRQNREGGYVLASDYDALAAETTAYVDKLVAEKREMEAALTKVHGIVAEYWGPCPGSVETLLTIRDVLGTKNWRPNVDFMPRLLTPSETDPVQYVCACEAHECHKRKLKSNEYCFDDRHAAGLAQETEGK